MNVLAIDVGSSSVKMGVLRDGRLVGRNVRVSFPTRYDGERAEVAPQAILKAVAQAARELSSRTRTIDVIGLASMAPSWLAMDSRGKPLTPVVTHQDRRSIDIAAQLEQRVGKKRHLMLAGNRPVPGGISSTTCAWFLRHEPALMRRADLIGHVQTYLHRQLTGERVVDPSNASFMGLYSTTKLSGWNDELCRAVGISRKLLPEVRDSNQLAGKLLPDAARMLGLPQGVPILVGMVDTGAAMLLAGAKVGQMVNVAGSTDVLALCTDHPHPHERLLLRGLGVGRKWVSVGTIAAAGSSLNWAREQLFADWSEKQFFSLVSRLSAQKHDDLAVQFDPYLAGDRCSVEQRRGAFTGLTLSTTREQMLAATLEALARVSAERIELLRSTGTAIHRNVLISGGGGGELAKVMHRDWPGRWRFRAEDEATMKGLAVLAGSM
jgi:xylulokinase